MFDDYPKTVVLTDGTHVVLRRRAPDDRARMDALLDRVVPFDAPRGVAPGVVVVVAVDGGRAAGALALDRDEGTLQVVLDPDYRGRRLGTWMLLDAIHLAVDLGMARLAVRVAVGDDALRAALDRLDFQSGMVGGDGEAVLTKTLHRGWTDL